MASEGERASSAAALVERVREITERLRRAEAPKNMPLAAAKLGDLQARHFQSSSGASDASKIYTPHGSKNQPYAITAEDQVG